MRIGCLVRTVGVFLLVVCGGPQAIGQSPTEARKKSAAGQGMIYLSREEILDGAKKEGNLLVYPGVDEKARTERLLSRSQTVWPIVGPFSALNSNFP